MADCYLGVDVGTGSVRTGLVNANGELLARSEEKISRKSSKPGHYEQSSQEIWSAVISTVRAVLETSNTTRDSIKGIGFDATCSLVVEDKNGVGLPVGEDQDYDIIMWCDHRASAEAQLINTTKHKALNYVGGQVSLEMQLPKLLWLKNNNNDLWVKSGNFFDLPDWLTYKATGSDSRSFCSVVCKWNYLVESNSKVIGWDKTLFRLIGLEDLEENEWNKIGKNILTPGSPVGLGLSKQAADDLGLLEGTAIGTSLIDAHAGALGMLKDASNLIGNLGLVSGTSTCHMLLSENQNFVTGVWGPYWSAIIDGLWLMEGGQSLTGGLLDFIIQSHPAYSQLLNISEPDKVYSLLENRIKELTITNSLKDSSFLTKNFHMTVDFHGNRSPLADPLLTGSMVGLTVTKDLESLAVQYLGNNSFLKSNKICLQFKNILLIKNKNKIEDNWETFLCFDKIDYIFIKSNSFITIFLFVFFYR